MGRGRWSERARTLGLYVVTALDDILVEKVWYRLKRGEYRVALGELWAVARGFPGCTTLLAVAVLLLVLALRAR